MVQTKPPIAPAFHTSDSWEVREDRLSTPLTGIYNVKDGQYLTVIRKDEFCHDALTTHSEGEVILSGKTSIGFTGFANHNGKATLSFGFPYRGKSHMAVRMIFPVLCVVLGSIVTTCTDRSP